VEKAHLAIGQGEAEKLQKKVVGKGKFTLEDFLTALKQVQRMGPLEQLVKLIPGVGARLPTQGMDPKRIKHVEAIILSMTPQERATPELLNGSRRARIAKGSGRPVSEVNRLLKQFKQMNKMMKQLKGMRGMPGLPGMMPR
jgi:signal recognition particle subunit SRP54